jgi:hypothetical protein
MCYPGSASWHAGRVRRAVWRSEPRAEHVPLHHIISQPHELDNPTTRTRWLWVSAM